MSYNLPSHVLLKLYNSLVYPHLSYGIVVWGATGVTNKRRLLSVQNKVVSLLRVTPSMNIYLHYNILTFDNIFRYFTLLKLYRFLNNLEIDTNRDIYLSIFNSQIDHNHHTRFKAHLNFQPPFFHKSKCQQSFVFQSLKLWNELPIYLKQNQTYNQFKFGLKSHLISNS